MTHGLHGSCGEHETGHCLQHAAESLLAQCEQFVKTLNQPAYSSTSKLLEGGTIGKHLRHLLDHYQAICARSGEIAYDHRERGGTLETDPGAGLEAIRTCRRQLQTIFSQGPSALEDKVEVRIMASPGVETQVRSTIAREIAFATHHAVHHQAMMRAIAAELGAGCTSDEFGVAPSTIAYQRLAGEPEPKPAMKPATLAGRTR